MWLLVFNKFLNLSVQALQLFTANMIFSKWQGKSSQDQPRTGRSQNSTNHGTFANIYILYDNEQILLIILACMVGETKAHIAQPIVGSTQDRFLNFWLLNKITYSKIDEMKWKLTEHQHHSSDLALSIISQT